VKIGATVGRESIMKNAAFVHVCTV